MKPQPTKNFRALTFKRCGIPFGVAVSSVQEIRKFESYRPLALGVHPLVGLVSFGERIIPVFDPHAFGSATRQPVGQNLTTIICNTDGAEVALLCDEVLNQSEFRPENVQRRAGAASAWLHGEVELAPGRKMLLLDVDSLAPQRDEAEPEPLKAAA